MKYLGSVVTHPVLGEGVVVFEENSSVLDWRVLVIAFTTKTVEVIPARLNEHGYRLTGARLSLQSHRERLWGHDALEGWAIGSKEALRALEEKEMVA